MKYGVHITTEIRNGKGKVIGKRVEKSDTFVKNFLMLQNACFKIDTSICVDTSGTPRSTGSGSCWGRVW